MWNRSGLDGRGAVLLGGADVLLADAAEVLGASLLLVLWILGIGASLLLVLLSLGNGPLFTVHLMRCCWSFPAFPAA